jgi:hypothetical protein
MRHLIVLLPVLLAGCAGFTWGDMSGGGEKSAVQNNYSYCNVPQRLMIFRTSAEICRDLGGRKVGEDQASLLELYYQGLTSN